MRIRTIWGKQLEAEEEQCELQKDKLTRDPKRMRYNEVIQREDLTRINEIQRVLSVITN